MNQATLQTSNISYLATGSVTLLIFSNTSHLTPKLLSELGSGMDTVISWQCEVCLQTQLLRIWTPEPSMKMTSMKHQYMQNALSQTVSHSNVYGSSIYQLMPGGRVWPKCQLTI